jgi:lysyl-tRNA synthetase class 2
VVTVHDAVSKAAGEPVTVDTCRAELLAICAAQGVSVRPDATAGEIVVELYEELVEKHTVEPTFYTDFPLETSALTRVHRKDPRLAERWDLVAFGAELGTAYSELIDPIDQRARLVRQSLKGPTATRKPCRWTRRSWVHSSARCRRPVGWAWVLIDW